MFPLSRNQVRDLGNREVVTTSAPIAEASSAPVAPIVKTRAGAIAQLGGVGEGGVALPMGSPFPEVVTFTLDNSAGGSAKNYKLFDPMALVAAQLAGTWNDADSTSAGSVAALKEAVKVRPLILKGFNYRITTGSASQFSNAFKYHRAGIDGSYMAKPIFVSQAIRNTQQNDKVLTIHQTLLMDSDAALTIVVAPGTTVNIEFFVQTQFNSF